MNPACPFVTLLLLSSVAAAADATPAPALSAASTSAPALAASAASTAMAATAPSTNGDKLAPKPLYRDPVYDGAADQTVIYNPTDKKWYMFYTVRRANVPGLNGVAWVHGTPIGMATSADGGDTWRNQQVTTAENNPFNPVHGFGASGCSIRTDSHGVVYVFAN